MELNTHRTDYSQCADSWISGVIDQIIMEKSLAKKIGSYWSRHKPKKRISWWESPTIVRYVNSIVDGDYVDGLSSGLINRTKKLLKDRLPLEKGISVGCGVGSKEMNLILQGIVKSFDLFELSSARIDQGRILAKKNGLEKNITFVEGNAFSMVTEEEVYDLVHLNNSLHHMMDKYAAVSLSKQVLNTEGHFYMDDFVGANRFQWPDRQLEIASDVRKSLIGTKYLRNPYPKHFFSRRKIDWRVKRPNHIPDPSEAVDSEKILASIEKHFNDAEIIKTGGVIYHLALSNIIYNFDDNNKNDQKLLKELLTLEKSCIEEGHTHYAVCLCLK